MPARVPRLAVIVLIALASAPLLFWGANRWDARQAEAVQEARDRVVVATGGPSSSNPPTRGMTLGRDGFGTILAAPEVIAREDGLTLDRVETIAASVSRFIRGVPVTVPEEGGGGEPRICTLEAPPIWRGRLVLVDGCLRIQEEGKSAPGPLLLASVALYRDADDYLTVSIDAGLARGEIRVGAPNVRFTGVGCSMDAPVPAPTFLVKACGVKEMRRVSAMERRRYCTTEDFARQAQMRRQHETAQRRLEATRASCIARGQAAASCPPGVAPSPPELFYLECVAT